MIDPETTSTAKPAPPSKATRKLAVLDGVRKLLFGLIGLAALGGGLWFMRAALPEPAPGAALDPVTGAAVASSIVGLYDKFTGGVWLIVAAVVLGNVGEHVAAVFGRRAEGGAP